MMIETELAEMQRRTIERTRLEERIADLARVDAELVSMLDKDEYDVACGHIRKAVRALELRVRDRGCSGIVKKIRMGVWG